MTRLEEGWRDVGLLGELHDVDEGRHEVDVRFPYEKMDAYRTDWAPGVWDESWKRSLPPMVVNHSPDKLIGRATRAQSIRGAAEVTGRFSDLDAVPLARQVFAQVRDGDWPGWSYHFRGAQAVQHPQVRGARRFVKADMAEFGPVTFPAIPGAVAVGIRSEENPLTTVTLESLLALRDSGEVDEEGFRALVGEHFPEISDRLLAVGRRAVTQTLPHGSGSSLYHEPGNPSDGTPHDPNQHANELASRPPGTPTIDEILALRDKGHIDDDGVHALIRKHYPHLADHFKRRPPQSEDAVRSLLAETYGEDAVRHITIQLPKAGNSIIHGSPDDPDDDGDDDAAREMVSGILAALQASIAMSDNGDDSTRSVQDWKQVFALNEAALCAATELADIMGVETGSRASDGVSDESWDGDAGRFTPEQYKRSALIDTGEGAEDSKDRYKLPVREPDGKLNRAGVHAAAASLAGARGGVQASSEQKRAAARKLLGHYNSLGEKPPPSLLRLTGKGGGDDDGDRSVEPEEFEDALKALERKVGAPA